MLDFIKFVIKDTDQINTVWTNPDLDYKSECRFVVKSTGEEKLVQKKTFRNLEFKKVDHSLEISGSLHKYRNNGLHNANDFTVSECIATIAELASKFGFKTSSAYPNNLEYGVNIIAPINVTDLLGSLQMFQHGKPFIKYPDLKECLFSGSSYLMIKAYNKTLNYPEYSKPNTFRFECKTRQAKYLNNMNIFTLADLQNPEIYCAFSTSLKSHWNEVLLFDKTTKKGEKFKSVDFWQKSRENNHRNTFINLRKKYYKTLGEKSLHNLVAQGISEKLERLKNCAFSTSWKDKNKPSFEPETKTKTAKTVVHFPTNLYLEYAQRNSNDSSPFFNHCSVTGLDISMQKKESKFLFEVGLRYYKEKHPDTYQKIIEKFWSRKCKGCDEVELHQTIAHNIRNTYNNQKYRSEAKPKNQLALFE